MSYHRIWLTFLFYIGLLSCGSGTRTYVDYGKADKNPYWTGSFFEKAYVQFQNKNYVKAKKMFIQHLNSDSLALDFEGYGFLAECHNRLGQTDSGKIVYSEALNFLVGLKDRKSEHERFSSIFEQVRTWSTNYPSFPTELMQENGFVPFNIPPEPKGGWEAIAKNLRYPESVRKSGIEGNVKVKTLISENGDATKFEVVKSLNPACDEAAIAAIKGVKFKPAKLKGKASKVWVVLPVHFRLR